MDRMQIKTVPLILLCALCGCATHQPPLAVEPPPRVVPITVIPTFTVDPSRQYEREIWDLKCAINHLLSEKLKTNYVVISNPPELQSDYDVRIGGYVFESRFPNMPKIKAYHITITNK